MGKPSAPPPPDYAALAKSQGAANKETAITEFSVNNANQYTPWGSRQLSQNGTDAQGNPIFRIDTSLNPTDQANLDKTRGIQTQLLDLAPTAANNVWNQISKPMNPNNLPPLVNQVDTGGLNKLDLSGLNPSVTGVKGAPIQSHLDYSNLPTLDNASDVRNRAEQSLFDKFYSRYEPAAQIQQDQLNTRIANMGGVTDSDASRRMMGGLLTSQGDQLRQGIYDAINGGGAEAQRQFGMQLSARQQGVDEANRQGSFYNNAQDQGFQQGMGNANLNNSARAADAGLLGQQNQQNNATTQQDVSNAFANANLANATRAQGLTEQQTLRQMPLNELMALLSGSQVQQPQFQNPTPTQIAPPPIFQAGQAQWQAAQDNYRNEAGMWNNLLGGLGGLGAAAITKYSDRRLKSNVVRIGRTRGGANVYAYDIFGRRELGVMAQELLHSQPDAVSVHPSGFLMVNYAKVR